MPHRSVSNLHHETPRRREANEGRRPRPHSASQRAGVGPAGWLLGGIEWMAGQDAEDLVDRLSDPFYALDAEWRFVRVNKEAERIWGKCRDELIGRNMWEVFPQAVGSEPWKAHYRCAVQQREVRLAASFSPVIDTPIEVCIQPLGDGLAVYFRERHEAIARGPPAAASALARPFVIR